MQAEDSPAEPPDGSHPDWKFILTLGGPTAVSRLCEITPQAVSQWRNAGIPKPQRRFLKLLRPDVFTDTTQPGALSSPVDADTPVSQAGELDAV